MRFCSLNPLFAAVIVLVGCSSQPSEPPSSVTAAGGQSSTGQISTGQGGLGGADASGGADAAGGAGGAGGDGGCAPSLPVDAEVPEKLSETGLYADIGKRTLAPQIREFTPQYQLWSDTAEKSRWVYLPECDTIDSSDMNDWSFPVGTRFWKEFRVAGKLIETRLIQRHGVGPRDFFYVSYVWNDELTEAIRTPDGVANAKGTEHDVPSESQCRHCHGSHEKGGGRPSRALGFSALQLAGSNTGVTLAGLVADNKLSHAPDKTQMTAVGDATVSAALGYLHANCGNCHNSTADGVPQVDLDLWLDVTIDDPTKTGAYQTAVGKANTLFNVPHLTARVAPGKPSESSVWFRMNQRGNNGQMPPLASKAVDSKGLAAVAAWITSLQ